MTPHNLHVSHLSEDELDEVLLGIASPEVSAHLADCPPCTVRFTIFQTELRAQMAAFNQASLAWSEARSNTISRDIRQHKATPRLTLPALWSAAAALILAATFALHTSFQHTAGLLDAANSSAINSSTEAVHPQHDQHELASDNAMMAAIESETGTPQAAQFGIFQNTIASVSAPPTDATAQVRD